MRTTVRRRMTAAVAAAILAGTWAAGAVAQPAPHQHEAAGPQQLGLDQGGRKWATDAPLREGMVRIRGAVEPRLGAAHAGQLGPAEYRQLASQVETEVGGIVANCKLPPKADAMLHLVLADIGVGVEAMNGADAARRPEGLAKVAQAVNEYGRLFDHPGFRPIPLGH